MYKVEAVVKSNNKENLVLNEMPSIKYEQYGNYLLGIDQYGIFLGCYTKKYDPFSNAFAGRTFKIPMADGSFIEANGQYWDSGYDILREKTGSKLCFFGISTPKRLHSCYAYTSATADYDEYLKLRSTYSGKIYEYDEYKKFVKHKRKDKRCVQNSKQS